MFTEHLSICSSRKYSKVPLRISVSDIQLWTVQLHALLLLDHFLMNLISSSFARRNSSYSRANLTRCGTTAWQLGLAWLLLKSKIRASWVVEVKLPCCYWMQKTFTLVYSSGYTRKYRSDIFNNCNCNSKLLCSMYKAAGHNYMQSMSRKKLLNLFNYSNRCSKISIAFRLIKVSLKPLETKSCL